MSRLPVREALIELAHESLIDAVPRRGAFVARLDRADIVDHYRIFGLIAGLAASRAATALTEERDAHEAQRIGEHHLAESGDLAVEFLPEMGYWDREAASGEASEPGAA